LYFIYRVISGQDKNIKEDKDESIFDLKLNIQKDVDNEVRGAGGMRSAR
jgi:hypothetical protein